MPKPLTYPRVLGALKRTFGPAARIDRLTEHGVPLTRVTTLRNGERVVLSQRFGAPDLEAILLDGVAVCQAWRTVGALADRRLRWTGNTGKTWHSQPLTERQAAASWETARRLPWIEDHCNAVEVVHADDHTGPSCCPNGEPPAQERLRGIL